MRGFADEEGTISAFVAVLAVALVAVAGLAYDGGQIIRATADARDLAGAAARAGAQQLATARSTPAGPGSTRPPPSTPPASTSPRPAPSAP
jgi:Flp pilus assembly protein TadG